MTRPTHAVTCRWNCGFSTRISVAMILSATLRMPFLCGHSSTRASNRSCHAVFTGLLAGVVLLYWNPPPRKRQYSRRSSAHWHFGRERRLPGDAARIRGIAAADSRCPGAVARAPSLNHRTEIGHSVQALAIPAHSRRSSTGLSAFAKFSGSVLEVKSAGSTETQTVGSVATTVIRGPHRPQLQ